MLDRPGHHGQVRPHHEEPHIVLDPDEVNRDVVEFGAQPTRAPDWRRWVLPAVAVLAVVAAGIGYSRIGNGRPDAARSSPPVATTTRAAANPEASTVTASPATKPTITVLDQPLLGVTAGWELFGRSSGNLVRIGLAAGRISTMPIPSLASNGPMAFLAMPQGALIRPLDNVQGYLVPDDQSAQPLQGLLTNSGPALPGPRPNTVWRPLDDAATTTMGLVDMLGVPTGDKIAVPGDSDSTVFADGSGYLLQQGPGGVYWLRPSGVQRIATGQLIAVGATRWLVQDCDEHAVCSIVVITKSTGGRRVLNSTVRPDVWPPGLISPDGGLAAVIDMSGSTPLVTMVNLATGDVRSTSIHVLEGYSEGQLVWSPDSQWLFVVSSDNTIHAIRAATGDDVALGVPLPPIVQLAIRPAAS